MLFNVVCARSRDSGRDRNRKAYGMVFGHSCICWGFLDLKCRVARIDKQTLPSHSDMTLLRRVP